ncbi:MAG: N-acetylgalactosamine-6-sulfatase, partial [Pedosphaera sp.]|nr:N-acetylgalactosamine-6-sulfatase [Pedosphaera sp.]
MKTFTYTRWLVAASAAVLGFTPLSAAEKSAIELRPPNVVFIIADDLGYGDIGSYGQKKIRTPHLDRMAAEGMRFTQHYSGNAVCAPSRCVLMTGKHPGHAFIRDNKQFKPGEEGQYPIPADTVTLAKLFQQRGYAVGGFGKWGLGGPGTEGEPLKQGFTRWFGYNCQAVAHNFY